jgi:hypothetical protein
VNLLCSLQKSNPPPSATKVAQSYPAYQRPNETKIKGQIRSTLNAFIKNKNETTVHFPAEVKNGSAVAVTKKGKGFSIYSTDDSSPIYLDNLQTVINHIYYKVTSNNKNKFLEMPQLPKRFQPPTDEKIESSFTLFG